MFHGTVGVFTGFKDGAFSVASNSRLAWVDPDYDGYTEAQLGWVRFVALFNEKYKREIAGVLDNLFNFLLGKRSHTWLMREVLEQCDDYQCALRNLGYTPICSLVYYVLAGTEENQGASIARDRDGPANFEFLDSENGKWYVAQTNGDTWTDYNPDVERGPETMLNKAIEQLDAIG